ncbi:hypothetical protein QL285_033334 [Trifolium repens]|nr:hypothetical protein QL285_033334 [Trifolium repens]
MFRLIKQCTVAKDAWEILKTTHEGTSKVKMSRLQLLTMKFENLRMKEYECIHDFHMNILDFANSFDSLGEKISEKKLVRKILRSLPKRFDMKVTAIEEAQDISNMKVDELIGSLLTFELTFNDRSEKKKKNIAFVSNIDDDDDDEIQCDMETNEGISNVIVDLGRQFNKVLNMMDRKPRPNVENMSFKISKNSDVQRKGEPNDEAAKHVAAFTGRYESDEDSCDEEVTYEELLTSYKELYAKDEEICKILEKQKKTINQLQTERSDHLAKITELNDEVTQLNSQLEHLKKYVRMMNTGTNLLDEILEGQSHGKPKAIGFDYRTLNKYPQNLDKKFVPTVEAYDPTTGKSMLQHPKEHPAPKFKGRSRRWICHHCGKKGHIRHFCFKLYGYPGWYQQAKPELKVINVKKEWKPKEGSSALITNATPITTVPVIAAKKNKTSTVKKGTSMPVSESPSTSIYVPFGTETRSLVKPKSDKTLGQPSLNVAIECANMSPTKLLILLLVRSRKLYMSRMLCQMSQHPWPCPG